MAKPTFGMRALITDVIGTLGNAVYAKVKGGIPILRQQYKERKRSDAQEAWAEKYNTVDRLWESMDQSERNAWRLRPWRRAWSNYAWFMSRNLENIRDSRPLQRVP